MERILRLPQVLERTTLGKSIIYKMVSKGEFPKPIKLGGRATGWREADVDAWIKACQPAEAA